MGTQNSVRQGWYFFLLGTDFTFVLGVSSMTEPASNITKMSFHISFDNFGSYHMNCHVMFFLFF